MGTAVGYWANFQLPLENQHVLAVKRVKRRAPRENFEFESRVIDGESISIHLFMAYDSISWGGVTAAEQFLSWVSETIGSPIVAEYQDAEWDPLMRSFLGFGKDKNETELACRAHLASALTQVMLNNGETRQPAGVSNDPAKRQLLYSVLEGLLAPDQKSLVLGNYGADTEQTGVCLVAGGPDEAKQTIEKHLQSLDAGEEPRPGLPSSADFEPAFVLDQAEILQLLAQFATPVDL